MVQSLTQYIKKNFLGQTLSFEDRVYGIFFIASYILSLIFLTANVIFFTSHVPFRIPISGIVLQIFYILICTIVLFLPLRIKACAFKVLLFFAAFIYIPYIYFQAAGYHGSTTPFVTLMIFMLCIVLKGKVRVLVVVVNIASYAFFAILKYNIPFLFESAPDGIAELLDWLLSLILCLIGTALLAAFVSRTHERELLHIEALLTTLEKNNKILAEMNNRDSLTNIYNRRYMTEFLSKELESCQRTENSLCIMMMDLDFFKVVNDTYGHGFGDEVLIKFAKTVQENLRSYDVLARYGGEEFLAALHHLEIDQAFKIAERIRIAVEEMRFRDNVKISVSIGLVQSRPGEQMESLLLRSDVCLYAAKNAGRNRVIVEE